MMEDVLSKERRASIYDYWLRKVAYFELMIKLNTYITCTNI